jgi:hypothetical protein
VPQKNRCHHRYLQHQIQELGLWHNLRGPLTFWAPLVRRSWMHHCLQCLNRPRGVNLLRCHFHHCCQHHHRRCPQQEFWSNSLAPWISWAMQALLAAGILLLLLRYHFRLPRVSPPQPQSSLLDLHRRQPSRPVPTR